MTEKKIGNLRQKHEKVCTIEWGFFREDKKYYLAMDSHLKNLVRWRFDYIILNSYLEKTETPANIEVEKKEIDKFIFNVRNYFLKKIKSLYPGLYFEKKNSLSNGTNNIHFHLTRKSETLLNFTQKRYNFNCWTFSKWCLHKYNFPFLLLLRNIFLIAN